MIKLISTKLLLWSRLNQAFWGHKQKHKEIKSVIAFFLLTETFVAFEHWLFFSLLLQDIPMILTIIFVQTLNKYGPLLHSLIWWRQTCLSATFFSIVIIVSNQNDKNIINCTDTWKKDIMQLQLIFAKWKYNFDDNDSV